MKVASSFVAVLVAGVMVLTGCNKAPAPAAPTAGGVTIDLPKLQAAFPGASPEIRSHFDEINFGIRYGDFNKCAAALDKLAATPNLTDAQKKAIGEVSDQVKKAAAGAGAKPG